MMIEAGRELGSGESADLAILALVPLNEFEYFCLVDSRERSGGELASTAEWARALGQMVADHRLASRDGGRVQQCGSGHSDVERLAVPRPRSHLTCSYGVPTATASGS
jgi:hypothetical protein